VAAERTGLRRHRDRTTAGLVAFLRDAAAAERSAVGEEGRQGR
jgi:hypothetical protein